MVIRSIERDFSVCKVSSFVGFDPEEVFCFIARTDEERSLVCPTDKAPANTVSREDGWRGFRIEGTLDFSLVGILARISTLLAEKGIGLFAVSTFNTDYIFTKKDNYLRALDALAEAGYEIT